MPQDHDNQWPSFEAVLHDVATAEPGPLAASDESLTDQGDSHDSSTSSLATMNRSVQTSGDSTIIDLLPAPLPPLDIDTSAVRALLMPPGQDSDEEQFHLEALEPLEPATTIEPLEPVEPVEPAAILEDEPPSVFDLAFDPEEYAPVQLDDVVPDETTTSEALTDDLAGGAVFELDEESFPGSEPLPTYEDLASSADDGFTTPTIDLFDLQVPDEEFDSVATANAIEGDLNEINDLMPDFSLDDAEGDDAEDEPFHLDNVVRLHPDEGLDWIDPTEEEDADVSVPETVNDAPPATRVSHTGWVGLEAIEEPPAPVVEEVADPWAHMRPTEEVEQAGFWAKIFGGDERKRAKARRRHAEQSLVDDSVTTAESGEISFDRSCPNCGGECQVDLDDPIGRRVHVSCPACDHMWFTPYLESEAG